jgi:hypothetical protein
LRTDTKLTNILKERANTINRDERDSHGFKNPEIEYLLTKWHHEMLLRMVARIITLGYNTRTESLGGSLKITQFPINFNRYVRVMEYLNTAISVVGLAKNNIRTGRDELQMHQTV